MMVPMPEHVFVGRCHCGNLSLRLETARDPVQLGARACTCGFCRPRHMRWTSDPAGRVTLQVDDPSALSRYRFGTSTADFLICRRCGTVLAAVDLDAGPRAVLNVDVLDAADRFPEPIPASFDGETTEDRRARRSQHWTPATLQIPDHG